MALPSQTERGTSNGRSVMVQPGGANATRIAIVVAGLVLLAGGIYGLSQWSGGAKSADAAKVSDTKSKDVKLASKSGGSGQGNAPIESKPQTTPDARTQVKPDALTDPKGDARTAGTTPPPKLDPLPTDSSVTLSDSTGAQPVTGGATAPGAGQTPGSTAVADASTGSTAPNLGAQGEGLNNTNLDLSSASLIAQGDAAVSAGKLVEARALLSRALLARDTDELTKESLRAKLTQLNANLVFSASVTPGDPLVESYQVQSGDSMVRIARRRELATDWRLIQRVNRIANPNALKLGQTIKLVKGPFHAVVNKSAYRVDVYAGSPEEPSGWLYIKSYRAGLGESDTTPLGNYVIKKASKLVNPPWVNPRTGEKFGADDPKNPIGEHWIGWQGVGESKGNTGYGFHGTIDPTSIGQQKSMGCVRLGSEDVAELYELLVEEVSVVRVLP